MVLTGPFSSIVRFVSDQSLLHIFTLYYFLSFKNCLVTPMTGQMVIYQMNLWMIEMNIVLDIRGQVSLLIGTQGFKRQDMGAKNHVMETPHVSGNILADTLLVTQPMLQR